MKEIYLLLAHHQKFIKHLFLLTYIVLISGYIGAVWFYPQLTAAKAPLRDWGKTFGQASIVLMLLTLIPGMLMRFNFFRTIESTLILFRRQFGVLAFFTAFMHVGLRSWIKLLATGSNPLLTFFKFQQTGFAALTIFILLWVTSNDLSMRILGKWWKYLQRFSYVAAIFLILHIKDAASNWWWPITIFLVFETLSWITYFIRHRFVATTQFKR